MPPRRHKATVEVLRVHPLVWKHALDLCGDDPRRIEVLNEKTVFVHNQRTR